MARWLALAFVLLLAPDAAWAEDPFAPSPASPEALEARWIAAHTAGDEVAAYNLFEWRGVTPATRAVIRAMIDRDLADRLLGTRLVDPATAGLELPPPSPGLAPNLPTERLLVIEFAAADGTRHVSLHRLGSRDGIWRIALPVPAARP